MTRRAWPVLFGLLGLAGLLIVFLFHERGVPVASIDFKVLRPEAEVIARKHLAEQGFDLAGYQSSVTFETDREAQGFVERTAGQQALDRIAASEITIWRWTVRFFRELDPLEYSVSVLPDSTVAGWNRALPETAAGPPLDEKSARSIAEASLRASGIDLAGWTLAGTTRENRPNRIDYRFTWERDAFRIGEATKRRWALVQGASLGGFGDYLKVPEIWVREQRIETNRGIVLTNVGWTLTYGIGLAAAIMFIVEWQAGRIRCRLPWLLAAGLSVVALIALVNQLPLWLAGYPTTASEAGYYLGLLRDQTGQLLIQAIAVFLAAGAGLAIWPRAFPKLANPSADFSIAGFVTSRFRTAILIGYAAAGVWLGYFTLFYWLGTSWLGFWSPVELPYRDVMSGYFPAAFPLFVGAGAAIAEETVFRLFAIPAGALAAWAVWTRMLGRQPGPRARSVLLSVVIVVVAAIWGTLHSTYPQEPFYVRAVEVGLVGVLAGFVLLRWGLVATMATHYTGNTAIVGALFLMSGNRDLQLTAIAVTAVPLMLLFASLAAATFRPAVDLAHSISSSARPTLFARPAMSSIDLEPRRAVSHRGRVGRLGVLVLVPVVLALAAISTSVPRTADGLRLTTDRAGALAAATEVLRDSGAPAANWLVLANVVDTSSGPDAAYLLQQSGPEATSRFFSDVMPAAVWQVRFTLPLQKDEVWVQVGPDGRPVGFSRLVEEAAPGDSPDPISARSAAERILARWVADSADWDLVSTSQLKRDRRVDSVFTWERRDWRAGDARIRAQIGVIGLEPGSYRQFVKLPEAFLRDFGGTSTSDGSLQATRDAVLIVLAITSAILFFRRLAERSASATGARTFALLVGVAWLLTQVAGLPTLVAGFRNTLDLPTFVAYQVSLRLREGMVVVGFAAAAGALVPPLWRRLAGRRLMPSTAAARGHLVLSATAGAISLLALDRLAWALRTRYFPETLRAPAGLPPFDALLPAVASVGSAATSALLAGASLLVLIYIATRIGERAVRFRLLAFLAPVSSQAGAATFVLVAFAALWGAASAHGPADALLSAAIAVGVTITGLVLWHASGREPLTIGLAIGLTPLARDASALATSGANAFWLANSAAVPLVALVVACCVVASSSRSVGNLGAEANKSG